MRHSESDALRVMVHDLNNQLGAILNFTQLVAKEVARAADGDLARPWDVARDDLDQISQAVQRAIELAREMGEFAHRPVED